MVEKFLSQPDYEGYIHVSISKNIRIYIVQSITLNEYGIFCVHILIHIVLSLWCAGM